VLALSFQKFMITLASAFIGAVALVSALSGEISGLFQTTAIGLMLVVIWVLMGCLGVFVQYKVLKDGL
jgi:hypothetical protein